MTKSYPSHMATDWFTAPVSVGYGFDPFVKLVGRMQGMIMSGRCDAGDDADDDGGAILGALYSIPWHIGLNF